ncbi:MAG: hypothetical protein M9933_11380 [Chitinophagaceae bacterium]|nr:hypothetical protein [Chitinophagaceae bacterium]
MNDTTMRDFKELSNNINSAIAILNDMIAKAKAQGAQNFDMLYNVKDGLNELSQLLISRQKINDSFLRKWDETMGWVPRVFEGHPLLEILRQIDNVITSDKSI